MSLILLLAAWLTWVEGESAQPASEASIDAFLAALPPAESRGDAGDAFDRERLERLEALNPGHEAEIRELLAANRQCADSGKQRAVKEALRATARRLGDDRLTALTAFYKSPDYALFGRLSKQRESELSDAEKAEVERILAAYPLEDFFASSRQTERDMWSADGLLGVLMKCRETLEAELARRGLDS